MRKLIARIRFWLRPRNRKSPPPPPTQMDELIERAEAAVSAVALLTYKVEDAFAEKLIDSKLLADACNAALFQASRCRDELLIELTKENQA